MDFKQMSDDAPPQVVVATVNDSANGLVKMYSDLEPSAARLKSAAKVLLFFSVLRLGSPAGVLGFLSAVFVLCFAAPGSLGTAYSARWVRILAILSAICSAGALILGMLVGIHFILMPDSMAAAVCPPPPQPTPVQVGLAPDFLNAVKADGAPRLGQDGHGLPPLLRTPHPPLIGEEGHSWSVSDTSTAITAINELPEVRHEDDLPRGNAILPGRRLHESQFEHTHARGDYDDDDDEEDEEDEEHHRHHEHHDMSHFHMLHHFFGSSHEACQESLHSLTKIAPFLLTACGLIELSLFAAAVCTARRALKITKKARAFGANAM